MTDEERYREAFSRLRASDEAKKEILMKAKELNTKRRTPRLMKAIALAAALIAALAVTASAAGYDVLGFVELQLTTIFDDGFHQVMVDEEGNEWNAYDLSANTELREGRLILTAMGQEADITDDLTETGTAVRTFTREDQDVTVTVTGSLEDHSIRSASKSAGLAVYESEPRDGDAPRGDIVGEDPPGTVFEIIPQEDPGQSLDYSDVGLTETCPDLP